MMDKFLNWYRDYQVEITWWIIGWLAFALFDALARGNWIAVVVDAVLIYINYATYKRLD